MGKVSKANTYFLIIMLLQLFLPVSKIFEIFYIKKEAYTHIFFLFPPSAKIIFSVR